MPRIQANRDTIDDRFSVLGFTVKSESPLFEVAVATDPNLFRPENRGRRAHANFYSSRAQGVTRARRGEAVYLLPPDVLSNFIGQPRLYFGLATYRENSRGKPDFVQAPTDGSMYVNTAQLTERGLRRSVSVQSGSAYGQNNGRDASLDWGGDAVAEPGAPATTAPTAPRNGTAVAPAKATAPAAAPVTAAAYDDGFGAFPAAHAQSDEGVDPDGQANYGGEPTATAQEVLLHPYDGTLESQIRLFAETVSWIAGVPDTTHIPHSAICHLLIYNGSTLKGRATGFYIGRNILMTNAHVVTGYTRLVVIPGKNGAGNNAAHEPFGRFSVDLTSATSRPHPSYVAGSRDFDMAIVRVPTAAPNGKWLAPIEELTQSRPEGVAVCGYSAHSRRGDLVATIVHATLDPEKQHLHRGYVRSITDDSFAYDVQELAGSSGSPVYWIEGGAHPKVHVVGVNAGPRDDVSNEGCRLTTAKVKWVRDCAAAWGMASAMEIDSPVEEALAIPLDPGAGGRSIGLSALRAGDIIVSTTRAFASRIIRLGTLSPVSHVMLYVGDGRVIESVGSGVRETALAGAIDDAILAVAYRHPQLDASRAAAVVAYARSRVGNPYNYAGVAFQGYRILNPLPGAVIEAIGRKLGVEVGQAGAVYCSELVLESFERAGLSLTAGARPAQSTPDQVVQIARSSLAYVGHLKAEDVPLGIQLGLIDAYDPQVPSTALAVNTPPTVRVRDRTRRPANFPQVRVLSAVERVAALALVNAVSPATGTTLTALRALPASHNVSVAVGPGASVGFVIGMGVGAGLVFAPGGQIGVYGQFDLRGGLIDSASLELQVTIVQGGIETFSGINFAVGVEFDAGVSVSGQALFNTSGQFQGVTVGIGAGLGVEPFQIYLAMQAGASQALALSVDEESAAQALGQASGDATARNEAALPPPPPAVIQQPLEVAPVAEAQAVPVVIPIVAAVVGAVFTRLLNNSGDVSWELDQMSGLKHPNDQAPNPLPNFQDGTPIRLVDWPYSGRIDHISAGFEIRWQFNGQSLGNVQILNIESNDAIGWGLTVKARIMNDSIVYPRGNPRFAALRVRLEYRFTRVLFSDQLAFREVHLFGDGTYNMTGDWTQNSLF